MRVMGLDVGVSTGYAVLDAHNGFEHVAAGTIMLGQNDPDSTYATFKELVKEYKPDYIAIEWPLDDKNNPLRTVLRALRHMVATALGEAIAEEQLIIGLYDITPSEWKTSPSKLFIMPFWKDTPNKVTKHQKDATRIAHYFAKFKSKKLVKEKSPA